MNFCKNNRMIFWSSCFIAIESGVIPSAAVAIVEGTSSVGI